jgi:hypothetical protein
MNKLPLSTNLLIKEAKDFSKFMSDSEHKNLIGVTDGKAVGTYVEQEFKKILKRKYEVIIGSSALGIDLPSASINTDIKVTSARQPQSSCPFKSATQKVFGLGYNLLLFVYEKDDSRQHNLNFVSSAFVQARRTADYTTTKRLIEIVKDNGNKEDVVAYLSDRNLPCDEILINEIADKALKGEVVQGYLTISNALQWRLQYQRIVGLRENEVEGVTKIM